jgi:hypothetical protein
MHVGNDSAVKMILVLLVNSMREKVYENPERAASN